MTEQRSPEQIRQDIEATREELADTAAALAHKADVKARAHDRVEEVKDDLRGKVQDAKATVAGHVDELRAKTSSDGSGANATADSVKTAAASAHTSLEATVRRKPIQSAAVAAALLGFTLGYLIARRHR